MLALAPDPDLNNDGTVNILDASIVGSCFGADLSANPLCLCADTDDRGIIDMVDVTFVTKDFGKSGFPIGPNACVAGPKKPIAEAGPNQNNVEVGAKVTLDGSNSSDPNTPPLPLTFQWTIIEVPAGSAAALDDASAVIPMFFANVAGKYTIQLIVNNGALDSDPATVMIFVEVPPTNTAPVADAGPDQSMVIVGQKITLDGSGSFDMDGDPLTFKWRVIEEPIPGACALADNTPVMPMFFADDEGICRFELVVNDGELNSSDCPNDQCRVTISTNSKPEAVAKIKNPGDFKEGDTVQLDGSESSDVDGDLLTFMWTLIKPNGSNEALNDPNAVMPEFVADVEGAYSAILVVSDGKQQSDPADVQVSVNVVVIEEPPVPVCELKDPTSEIFVDRLVTLDGSQSFDPNNDPITFKWSITKQPLASTATLSDASVSMPTITPDFAGMYMVQLIVNDGKADNDPPPCVVSFNTENRRPTADAGDNQSNVKLGDPVKLDGSGSFDPDKDPLTYKWAITSAPNGSTAELDDDEIVMPTFTPDEKGTYVVQLIVNDGELNSVPNTVVIMTEKDPDGTELFCGSLNPGFIEEDGEVDQFFFKGQVGQVIDLTLVETSNWSGSLGSGRTSNDARGTLFAPSGAEVGQFDSNTQQTFTLTENGTYVIRVNANNLVSTGTYNLGMECPNQVLPEVTLLATDGEASETGLDAATFTVTRTGPTTSALTVLYGTDGAATNGSDYQTPSGSVVIPIGQASAAIIITPIDDSIDEGPEAVVLNLTTDAAYIIGTPGIANATIADNDVVVSINATDPNASEVGLDPGEFTVTRSGGNLTQQVQVQVQRGGTATNGSDYVAIGGSTFFVTIPSNQTSATVPITPLVDSQPAEGDETVMLTILANAAYAIGTSGDATVTITDATSPQLPVVTLTASDTTASEVGPETGTFTVTRSGGNEAVALNVFFARSGTAANVSDYTNIGGSVAIPANETSATVTITPVVDNLVEGTETVTVTLNPNATYSIGTPATGTVNIADTDVMSVVNLVGSYVGNGSGTTVSCGNPTDNGPEELTRFEITSQTAQGFNATTADGDVTFSITSSNLMTDGSFSTTGCTFTEVDTNGVFDNSGTCSFNGMLSGDTIMFGLTVQSTVGDTCSFSGSFDGTR